MPSLEYLGRPIIWNGPLIIRCRAFPPLDRGLSGPCDKGWMNLTVELPSWNERSDMVRSDGRERILAGRGEGGQWGNKNQFGRKAPRAIFAPSAMAISAFTRWLTNPSKNWFAAQHCKAVSKRLRKYGADLLPFGSLCSSLVLLIAMDADGADLILLFRWRPSVRRPLRPDVWSGHQGGVGASASGGRGCQEPASQAGHGPLHEARVPSRGPSGGYPAPLFRLPNFLLWLLMDLCPALNVSPSLRWNGNISWCSCFCGLFGLWFVLMFIHFICNDKDEFSLEIRESECQYLSCLFAKQHLYLNCDHRGSVLSSMVLEFCYFCLAIRNTIMIDRDPDWYCWVPPSVRKQRVHSLTFSSLDHSFVAFIWFLWSYLWQLWNGFFRWI